MPSVGVPQLNIWSMKRFFSWFACSLTYGIICGPSVRTTKLCSISGKTGVLSTQRNKTVENSRLPIKHTLSLYLWSSAYMPTLI